MRELSADECRQRLMRGAFVGRLAVVDDGAPPVDDGAPPGDED